MYIFLDESGDLGFDFSSKKPSKFFTITLLICDSADTVKKINKAIERTLKNKILPVSKYRKINEIKATGVALNVKAYFLKQALKSDGWRIYSIILDKKLEAKKLFHPINVHRIYNVMTNFLMKKVDFSNANTVNLFVDQSKNRAGIDEFDKALQVNLENVIPFSAPLNITHVCSQKNRGIQATDLFCWGIFRYYEQNDESWYALFKQRISIEQHFSI